MELSIIIPVYNVSKYLNSCLESITSNYLFDNKVEIILIDDGSTDGSGDICETWSEKYPYIRTIHKKNGGLSSARNKGIDVARGRFLSFIDSDDIVADNFINIILKILEEKRNLDILIFSYQRILDDNIEKKINYSTCELIAKKYAFELLISTRHDIEKISNTGNYAWNKIYSRNLFEKVRYPKNRNYEDIATTYRLLDNANEIYLTDSILYYYTDNPNSIVNDLKNTKNIKDLISARIEQLEFLKKSDYKEIYAKAYGQLVGICVQFMHKFYNFNLKYDENIKYVESTLMSLDISKLKKWNKFRWGIELYIFQKARFIFKIVRK